MTVIKRFAQDSTAMGACMDQLVEVLVQLLEDKQDSRIEETANQLDAAKIAHLHSQNNRVIHVVGANPQNDFVSGV